jgi:hypothetical protein
VENTLGAINTSLVGILERLERMEQNKHDGLGRRNHNIHNTVGSAVGQDDEDYAADTELDEEVNGYRHTEQRCHHHEVSPRPPR